MNSNIVNKRPVYLSLIIIIFLIGLSFVGEIRIFNLKLKKIDFFADIRKDSTFIKEKQLSKLMQENIFNVDDQRVSLDDQYKPNKSNYSFVHLKNFWSSLESEEYKEKPIRIAYYGDSEIEGDLITSDLRTLLQRKYGGSGVGFLPLSSVDARFRNKVTFEYDEDKINTYALNKSKKTYDFGISGAVFEPKEDFTITFKTLTPEANYNLLRLFYKISDSVLTQDTIPYFFVNDNKIEISGKTNYLSQFVIDLNSANDQLTMNFSPNLMRVYGVSVEKGNGIYVDNFSLRGYSGTTLHKIPSENLKKFNEYLNYRLVVFQYGMNVLSDSVTNYSHYKNQMKRVVEYFKECFPKADILIVSIGDRGKKEGESYITDPNIFNLIKAQKQLAEETGSSFINLLDLMGGVNSIVKWVDKGLAAQDYLHISRGGAKFIGKRIFEKITNFSVNKDTLQKR